jgi:hypothetical protein
MSKCLKYCFIKTKILIKNLIYDLKFNDNCLFSAYRCRPYLTFNTRIHYIEKVSKVIKSSACNL